MSAPDQAPGERHGIRAETWLVAAITLVGALLRFYRLGNRSLWYDEAVIYHIVQGGWREILAQNAVDNSAPPLYALLLGLLTGPDASEAVLRGLSALAGVAAIPVCYLLGRQFLPARSAWLVPVLVAVAPTQVIYSQQLREYSLTTTVSALLLLACVRFVREPGRRSAAWFAAAAVLGLLTQYGIGLLLAGLNLVCLSAFVRSRQAPASYRHWFLAQLPAAATAVVLYLTVIRHQLGVVGEAGLGYLAPYYWSGGARGLLFLLAGPNHDIVAFALPGLAALLLWVVGLWAFLFGARSGLATAICLVPLAVTVAAAMAGAYPYGAIRQCIFLTPAVYVCIALGADRLLALLPARLPAWVPGAGSGLAALVLAAPALAGSLNHLNQEYGYQPLRIITGTLAAQLRPGDTIYVYYNAIPAFRYYWRDRPEPWIAGAFHRSFMDERKSEEQMAAVQEQLRGLMRAGRPYWVVVSHLSSADEDWLMEFLERYARVETVERGSGSALLWVTPRADDG